MDRINKVSFMERLKDMPIFISVPNGYRVYKELGDNTYSSFIVSKDIPVKCKECVNKEVCIIRPYERTIKNTFKIYSF